MASETLPAEHPPASAAKPALSADLIAAHFTRDGDKLNIGGVSVTDLAARFGTPLFIYDAGIMRARYRALADALGGFAEIHYSVKANPAPAVIRVLIEAGAGIEIASVGEYLKARAAGADAKRILFAGPGKQVRELEQVVRDGIGEIHLESIEEIERLSAIGGKLGVRVPVALRVNPVAAAQGGAMRMGGKPAPFGFDEEDIESILRKVLAQPALDLRGVHLFAGTQILDADVLLGQWRHGIDVARRIAALAERPLHTIDLGGGLGIPYFNGDGALDLAHLAAGVPALRAILQQEPLLASARVVVEPGRFLVGPAGLYVMAVNAVKLSRGTRFLVVDGGMHHHLAASGNLGQVIKRDYPVIAPARMTAADLTPATVAGPLCTPLDTLARKVDLPDLAAGDVIAIMQSGAYGLTASPVNFLSHPTPVEVLIDGDRIEAIPAA